MIVGGESFRAVPCLILRRGATFWTLEIETRGEVGVRNVGNRGVRGQCRGIVGEGVDLLRGVGRGGMDGGQALDCFCGGGRFHEGLVESLKRGVEVAVEGRKGERGCGWIKDESEDERIVLRGCQLDRPYSMCQGTKTYDVDYYAKSSINPLLRTTNALIGALFRLFEL